MSILNPEHWLRLQRCVRQYKKYRRQRYSFLFDGADHEVLVNPHNCSVGGVLDIDDVRNIRKLSAQGEKAVVLEHMYGVSRTVISKILNRQTWKELV